PLALPPLTAFVRAGEDTTVDVLASANATQGRVLMVSGASTADAGLSVSVVGSSLVRVSASSTSAEPGRLGVAEVTIADTAGNSATTQLTVFLLPASHGVGPVAAPDTVSVRAGSQVDVPVLANDVSPRGERIVLHPHVEGSEATGELAFASGSTLRYLAPQTPGIYVVRYSIYLENDPGRLDEGTLSVTVLPEGSNRPPQPPQLTARVLAGHSVAIPLKLNRIDPDGDTVSLANVTQPDQGQGAVSISASGDAMIYRASEERPTSGDVTFTYTVIDAGGAEATGTVKVGVLDAEQADVAPVTYADYVSARLGSTAPVTVEPLLNDRDPLQGSLEVIKLVPNADPASPEFARLESLIDPTTTLKNGTIVLRPGDVEGPHSYTYTVQSNASFSTAEGLIVIGVSDSPAPESLTVSDTVVTAQSRGELARGIDVVTGKAQWPTGDLSTLTLALWGDSSAGFTVSGWSITGDLPKERTVVPFSLTGADANGEPITTYGFLRIPAFDQMRLQAKPGASAIEVGEEQTTQIPLMDVLDIGKGDQVELRQDDSFAVQRGNARCVPSG
ncbi:MAG: cadherin-like domain-containing protein, partial [Demequinaceae bacterium]|nr:cadherin-like domain-containing protein [Demequinaceae bacterium]